MDRAELLVNRRKSADPWGTPLEMLAWEWDLLYSLQFLRQKFHSKEIVKHCGPQCLHFVTQVSVINWVKSLAESHEAKLDRLTFANLFFSISSGKD